MTGSLVIEGRLDLTETDIPGVGEPTKMVARNTGTTNLHNVTITPVGEGSAHVQLSIVDGVWAAAGEGIRILTIKRDEEEHFFARSTYSAGDAEDREEFELVANALSVG